jgi:hypothetical protein
MSAVAQTHNPTTQKAEIQLITTQEAEIQMIRVQGQPGQNVNERPHLNHKGGHDGLCAAIISAT